MKIFYAFILMLLVGCKSTESQKQENNIDELRENLYEIVLRHIFQHNSSYLKQNADFYVLEIDQKDPTMTFLNRFVDLNKAIHPMSKAKYSCEKGVYLEHGNAKGIKFHLDVPVYETSTRVVISWGYYEGCTSSSISSMILELRNGRWEIIGDEIIIIS